MKVGRPTKYNAQMVQEVYDFIDEREKANTPPFIERLSYRLAIDTDTIVEWAKKHKKFSVAIKRLKDVQRVMLEEHILGNNAAGGIFLLKNNHGFRDRTETDITSGGKVLPSPILKVDTNVSRNDSDKKDL